MGDHHFDHCASKDCGCRFCNMCRYVGRIWPYSLIYVAGATLISIWVYGGYCAASHWAEGDNHYNNMGQVLT